MHKLIRGADPTAARMDRRGSPVQRRSGIAFCMAFALVLGSVAAFGADVGRAPSIRLASDSPFLAPGRGSPGSGADRSARDGYELRGVMSISGGARYYIFDSEKKIGVWLSVHEPGHPIVIDHVDAGGDSIVVLTGDGRRLSLALRQSRVSSGPSESPALAEDFSSPPATNRLAGTPIKRVLEAKLRMERENQSDIEAMRTGTPAQMLPER